MARQPSPDAATVARVLKALRSDLRRSDAMAALADLCAGVPEYAPSRQAREVAMAGSIVRVADFGDQRQKALA
jgi:hypothetical protein